jgi:hypothetical protein
MNNNINFKIIFTNYFRIKISNVVVTGKAKNQRLILLFGISRIDKTIQF